MYHLSFYVPESHLEKVKNALFAIGVGEIGNYRHCAWQTKGKGQFYAKSNSRSAIGEVEQLTELDEYKVEMICTDELITQAIKVLQENHPYEEPAYYFVQVNN